MKPVVAIVGRPNVGKSTLFNRLTRSRNAIVVDVPGVTRDRHYGEGRLGPRGFMAIDTGGLEPDAKRGIYAEMARQADQAVAESDAVILLVDGRAGLLADDRRVAEKLRVLGRPLHVVVNKTEGRDPETVKAEFHELGLGVPITISAAHGDGVAAMIEAVLAPFPEAPDGPEDEAGRHPRVAVVGRPNVGKSTLVNALVGEERVIAFDQPGTTRDPIEVPFTREGRPYTLIDTAGLRKRGREGEDVEQFSIVKTLQAIERANVAVLVLDATEGVNDQDAHVAGYILERGRAVTVAINKWDAAGVEARERMRREFEWKLDFLGYAEVQRVSAKERKGLAELMRAVDTAYASAMAKLPTPRLTRVLREAVLRQAPPRRGYQRAKPRYAHQGGQNPPRIVIHGNALDRMPESYRRYLENTFRRSFKLWGTPLALEFRTGRNPYARS